MEIRVTSWVYKGRRTAVRCGISVGNDGTVCHPSGCLHDKIKKERVLL